MSAGAAHIVCPYCGDEWHTKEPFDCCGEVGHGVTLTQEQFDYMARTGCNVDEAQERPDATPDYREAWEYHADNARTRRRRELHGYD